MNFHGYDNQNGEWTVVFDDGDYFITYETTDSGKYTHWVKSPKKPEDPELQVGDPAALDTFLGGFASA